MDENMTEFAERTPRELPLGNSDTNTQGVAPTAAEPADAGTPKSAVETSGAMFAEEPSSDEGMEQPPHDDAGAEVSISSESNGKTELAEKNAAAAQRRRDKEARERESIRREAMLEALGHKNPYTGDAMTDERDVEEYLLQREIEKRGGDPVGEYAKYQKILGREQDARQKADDEAREAKIAEREEFARTYPTVDPKSLLADKEFVAYAAGKVGRLTMTEIYQGYLGSRAQGAATPPQNDVKDANADEQARIEARARELAAQMVANANASPGSAHSSTPATGEYFTREQVKAMSQKEVHKNYDAIMASMKHWN